MVITRKDGVMLLTPLRIDAPIVLEGYFDFTVARSLIEAELLEFCETRNGDIMLIDEEGRLKGKEINNPATSFYKYAFDKKGNQLDYIVGKAIIVPRKIFEKLVNEDNDEEEDKST